MSRNRPNKVTFEVVKPHLGLHFVESVGSKGTSIYITKVIEALNTGSAIKINVADSYLKNQIRATAKKLKFRLVYALEGDFLYMKPLKIEGEQERLILLLREPRTLDELKGKNLELHLANSLGDLAKNGLAHLNKGKWVLTEKGFDQVAPERKGSPA